MAPVPTIGLICLYLGLMCCRRGNVPELKSNGDNLHYQPIYTGMGETDISEHQGPRSALLTSESATKRTLYFSVSIETAKTLHVVDPRYLSTGISAGSVASVNPRTSLNGGFDPDSVALQTMLRGLSPAVLRVGGRSGDEILFVRNASTNAIQRPWINLDKFITGEQWKSLNEFSVKCGVDLAYTLNVAIRKGDAWDPTNAKELLDFNADLGYRVIWELGNEPKRFKKNYNLTISPRQLAKDFITLRGILSEDRYRFSNELVGPDMDHLPITNCIDSTDISSSASDYLHRFLLNAGDVINATTVHFYNIKPDKNTSFKNFTDPDVLWRTRCELQEFRKVMIDSMSTGSRLKWLGETSAVSEGGLPGVSNRYVAGFPILHNLGLAAEMGISVFIYWNLINGDYSLLDPNGYTPTPLYWACFLHKRLLGTHVLSVSFTIDGCAHEDVEPGKNKSLIHVFAHCTMKSPLYPAGAVTLMTLNLHNDSEVSLNLTGGLGNKKVDEYLLTPTEGNLTSRYTTLNGHVLHMKNSTHFPDIIPRPLPVGSPILLPPKTYGFYVIKDANAAVCRKK